MASSRPALPKQQVLQSELQSEALSQKAKQNKYIVANKEKNKDSQGETNANLNSVSPGVRSDLTPAVWGVPPARPITMQLSVL